MFIAQRMKKIDFIILKKLADEVSKEIVKFGDFQTIELSGEKVKKFMLTKNAADENSSKLLDLDKRINYLLATFESILQNLEMKEKEEISESGIVDTSTLEKNVKTVETELNNHYSALEKLRTVQQETKIRIKKINYFSAMDIEWEKTSGLKYFNLGFGSVPQAGYEGFASAMETLPTVAEKIDIVEDAVIVFFMGPSSIKDKVSQVLKSVYFKDYGIPAAAQEIDKSSLVHQAFELSSAYDEELWQEKEFKKKLIGYLTLLKKLKNSVQYYIAIERLKGEMASSGKVCLFSAWVPASSADKLEKKMEQVTGNRCVFLEQSASKAMDEEGLIAPTKFSNPFFIKPFEMLVSTFGTPNYSEIDPTPIMFLTYILMFGAMFGDVGHGVAIVLLGALVFSIKKLKSFRNFGAIGIGVGLSSIFFGFLYGAVFGVESVMKPLWMRPMEHIMDILTLAVVFGALVIMLALLLNIVNSIMEKNYAKLLFSTNGVAGLGFYGTLLASVFCMMRGIHFPGYIFFITGLCALMIALEKILERLLFSRHGEGGGEEKPSLALGFVDIYESAMGFLSNTISFIRVGAFALNHGALMSVVFVLASMSTNPVAQWTSLLLGNLFVIGFEGFIVAIQVLRLEYYEFFTRFFRASGKSFEGIGIYKQ
jgi:V/A-type H+-transporting ATPase subunit I